MAQSVSGGNCENASKQNRGLCKLKGENWMPLNHGGAEIRFVPQRS